MPEVEIRLKPSRLYIVFHWLAYLLSVAIVALLPLHWGIRTAIILGLSIYSALIFWEYVWLKGRSSIKALKLQPDGKWLLEMGYQQKTAELQGDSIVTRFVCLLRFKVPKRARLVSSIIFYDALPPEQYQQLILALKKS